MVIGAQFYTIRQFTQNLYDFSESLKKVADMGYTTVQISGTCPYEAEWLQEQLKNSGLSCVLTHVSADSVLQDTEQVCRNHDMFDCKNIGIGCMPGFNATDEIYDRFLTDFKPAAEKIKAAGHKLFYHNHGFEFGRSKDGRLFMDKLLDDFSPELLGITFDTYWAQFGGADPAAWIEKLTGRVECLHLKDMTIVDKTQRIAPVGWGNMNFERILAAAETAQSKYLLVEQDQCYEEDPFACLKKSYDYLTSLGLK